MTTIPLTIGIITVAPLLYPIVSSLYSGITLMKNNLGSLFVKDDILLNDIIEKYDLLATLDIINLVINENKISNNESMITAIKYLTDSITNINKLLNQINGKINEHNNKWFSSWRSIDYKDDINNLIKLIDTMEKRYNRLIELIPKNG